MIEAAHDNGMRVMMDFVVNHVHEDHEYVQSNPDWFTYGVHLRASELRLDRASA